MATQPQLSLLEKSIVCRNEPAKQWGSQLQDTELVHCNLSGKGALSYAQNIEIQSGYYSAHDFAWGARNVYARKAIFPGSDVFGGSYGCEANDCLITGSRAFYQSEQAFLNMSDCSGDNLLEESVKATVIADRIDGKMAFSRARDIQCYAEYIREIGSSSSGIIVAERIDRIAGNLTTRIYAVEVGEGKEFATIIPKKDFPRGVTIKNLDSTIAEFESKHRRHYSWQHLETDCRNYYWELQYGKRELEQDEKRIQMRQELSRGLNRILKTVPLDDKNLSLFSLKKLKTEQASIENALGYLEENMYDFDEAFGQRHYAEKKVEEIAGKWSKLIDVRKKTYLALMGVALISGVVLTTLPKIMINSQKALHERSVADIESLISRQEIGEAIDYLKGAIKASAVNPNDKYLERLHENYLKAKAEMRLK